MAGTSERRVIIPALTLWQPYASLIAVGVKKFETRSFAAPQRLLGQRIAIHAAKREITLVGLDRETALAIMSAVNGSVYRLPRGVVVCTAVLAESLPAESVEPDLFGDYSPGRFAWRLEDVQPVSPHIPARGRPMIGWPWETAACALSHDRAERPTTER
jgi:hypothetical protein